MNKVKINITIDQDVYDWLNSQRGMIPLSTFINSFLSERKEGEELIKNCQKDTGNVKAFIQNILTRIKGGDRFLEILSKEYLGDI